MESKEEEEEEEEEEEVLNGPQRDYTKKRVFSFDLFLCVCLSGRRLLCLLFVTN